MLRYESWLTDEALPAGGIGPNEADRLMRRHVLDSLVFAALAEDLPSGGTALDIGSGVGLPGIPLAIVVPQARFDLVDRSGRRCRLINRAVRVLGLNNVTVSRAEIEEVEGRYQLVTSRASLSPEALLPHLHRTVGPHGVGIVAGSTGHPIGAEGYITTEFRSEVLGNPRWMLMMRPS